MKNLWKFDVPEKEFLNHFSTWFGTHAVKIPMMPKGVEHRLWTRKAFAHAPACEDSNDAERR
jgi:hypothetical protein